MGYLEYQIKRTGLFDNLRIYFMMSDGKLRIEHALEVIFLMLYNIITTTYMRKDIGMFANFTQLYTT